MAAGTLTVASNAHAESGRRICEISFKAQPKNNNPSNPWLKNPYAYVSPGLDYKKDGACPQLNGHRLVDTGYVDWDQINPKQPVNKWTCEDWGDMHQTYNNGFYGADPCPTMQNDDIYVFIWQDPTTPDAVPVQIFSIGKMAIYQ